MNVGLNSSLGFPSAKSRHVSHKESKRSQVAHNTEGISISHKIQGQEKCLFISLQLAFISISLRVPIPPAIEPPLALNHGIP